MLTAAAAADGPLTQEEIDAVLEYALPASSQQRQEAPGTVRMTAAS